MNSRIIFFIGLLVISSSALAQADQTTGDLSTGDQPPAPNGKKPAVKISLKCGCMEKCIRTKKIDINALTSGKNGNFKNNPILNVIFSEDKDLTGLLDKIAPDLSNLSNSCSGEDQDLASAKKCYGAVQSAMRSSSENLKTYIIEAIDSLASIGDSVPGMALNYLNECQSSCGLEESEFCPSSSFNSFDLEGAPDVGNLATKAADKLTKSGSEYQANLNKIKKQPSDTGNPPADNSAKMAEDQTLSEDE